jgi:hypothetical protein
MWTRRRSVSGFEGFVRASELAGSDVSPEDLGLDAAAGFYKGYEICADQSLRHPRHAKRMAKGAFYVQAKSGTVGWVPWVGSTVVWPWEAGAWLQDLDRDEVHADSVPAKEKK